MKKCSTKSDKNYFGFDVSQKKIEIFALRGSDGSEERGEIPTTPEGVKVFLEALPDRSNSVIVLETGTHSTWLNQVIESYGAEVIVANARELRFIWNSDAKSDSRDAEMLARVARLDRKLLHGTRPLSKEEQEDILLLKVRESLVRERTRQINAIRGWLRSLGESDEGLSVENLSKELYPRLSPKLKKIFSGYLKVYRQLTASIKEYDKALEKKCQEHPETEILRQVKGVGSVTALSFYLLVRDPERFRSGGQLAAYFGLVPKRDQSGETDKQLGITKAGSSLMRSVLVQAAHYILGAFGEDCDLRDFGLRIASRGGAVSKRKASVAVARKLCTVLLALWKDKEIVYDPHFKTNRKKVA